jgi:hypothetical protein
MDWFLCSRNSVKERLESGLKNDVFNVKKSNTYCTTQLLFKPLRLNTFKSKIVDRKW